MEKKISTIKDLIDDMKNVYQELREERIELKRAKEISNIAGKILKASALKLDYNKFLEDKNKIEFLE